jgi:hypothetical protein
MNGRRLLKANVTESSGVVIREGIVDPVPTMKLYQKKGEDTKKSKQASDPNNQQECISLPSLSIFFSSRR